MLRRETLMRIEVVCRSSCCEGLHMSVYSIMYDRELVLRADLEYSPGPVTRRFQVGDAAQQNLGRNFPEIDHWDAERGVAVSIKSTTQVDTASQFMRVVRGATQRLKRTPASPRSAACAGRG